MPTSRVFTLSVSYPPVLYLVYPALWEIISTSCASVSASKLNCSLFTNLAPESFISSSRCQIKVLTLSSRFSERKRLFLFWTQKRYQVSRIALIVRSCRTFSTPTQYTHTTIYQIYRCERSMLSGHCSPMKGSGSHRQETKRTIQVQDKITRSLVI